jgi:hypothetical protein
MLTKELRRPKSSSLEPAPASEPEREDAATIATKAVALLAEIRDNGGIAPEQAPAATEPKAILVAGYHAPVPDAVAARRAKWAMAKRAYRALAKTGREALTAAAGQ